MRRRLFFAAPILLILVAASTMSCLPWQRPSGDELVYSGPTERGVVAGEALPGTDIVYAGLEDDEADVRIAGQKALKRKGDSLDWDGHPLPGVTLNLKQRIVWYTEDTLHAAGTARLAVDAPQPAEAYFPANPPVLYKLPVTYNVRPGEAIPGTTLVYVGSDNSGAELSGIDGYPYRKIADSITWEGRLRDGVYLDMNLRVVFFNESMLQLAGLASIGLAP